MRAGPRGGQGAPHPHPGHLHLLLRPHPRLEVHAGPAVPFPGTVLGDLRLGGRCQGWRRGRGGGGVSPSRAPAARIRHQVLHGFGARAAGQEGEEVPDPEAPPFAGRRHVARAVPAGPARPQPGLRVALRPARAQPTRRGHRQPARTPQARARRPGRGRGRSPAGRRGRARGRGGEPGPASGRRQSLRLRFGSRTRRIPGPGGCPRPWALFRGPSPAGEVHGEAPAPSSRRAACVEGAPRPRPGLGLRPRPSPSCDPQRHHRSP